MTTTSKIARRFAGPLIVGVLTLAACGSDDSPDAAPAEETTAATATPETPGTASYDEFCTALAEYIERPSDPDEADDPADFEPVVEAAPPEIADDMRELQDMSVRIFEFDEMTASGEEIAEFEAVLERFDPLAAEMQAWSTANCPT